MRPRYVAALAVLLVLPLSACEFEEAPENPWPEQDPNRESSVTAPETEPTRGFDIRADTQIAP